MTKSFMWAMNALAFLVLYVLFPFVFNGFDGWREALGYRANDPFVFCTQGQRNPDKCWIPMPPYLGGYMMMPYCDPPNYYGKPWTSDDWASLAQYQATCPMAISSGSWTGPGMPEASPFTH